MQSAACPIGLSPIPAFRIPLAVRVCPTIDSCLAGAGFRAVSERISSFFRASALQNGPHKSGGSSVNKLSVVIPVFNEARTILEIVARVRAVPLDTELIIVDDCSTDGTSNALRDLERLADVVVVRHERNQGKGAALRSGFAVA